MTKDVWFELTKIQGKMVLTRADTPNGIENRTLSKLETNFNTYLDNVPYDLCSVIDRQHVAHKYHETNSAVPRHRK